MLSWWVDRQLSRDGSRAKALSSFRESCLWQCLLIDAGTRIPTYVHVQSHSLRTVHTCTRSSCHWHNSIRILRQNTTLPNFNDLWVPTHKVHFGHILMEIYTVKIVDLRKRHNFCFSSLNFICVFHSCFSEVISLSFFLMSSSLIKMQDFGMKS